jgi:signal transduction histidine kinase
MAHDLADHVVEVDVPATEVGLDPGFVHHVVGNLLSNAAKFTPPGSRITVRGGIASGTVTITVTDDGPGIAPEEQDQIFELFRQSAHSNASARGTGVGLTIVRRYVELVGGEVDVDSELGRGATFTVRFPAPPTRGDADADAPRSDEPGGSVR